ncbi:MAG: pyridoxal phosphate-dependent aminotransferase [Actinomycetia bacterium]|nr:pyridoxal phosphate-dependent aminotransferase [Actinomycetes bacterium]
MTNPVPDFDEMLDRRGTNSAKWDVAENELPMWVADMDFRTAPPIMDALRTRLEGGVLGYQIIPEGYAAAVAGWWSRRHGWDVDPAWILFATGVIPAVSSVVRTLTAPGEPVVIAPPVYHVFFNSVVNSGRIVLGSDLVRDPATGAYAVDWADLEAKLARPDVHLLIWCNPHNPVGRLWTADELRRLADLAARHDVVVVSDEIHCDLTAPGTGYVPFATVGGPGAASSITCVAPTKTFNLAGIQSGSVIVPDPTLRETIRQSLNRDEVAEPNAFAVDATIAAYSAGEPWLDALRDYVWANKRHAVATINDTIPGMSTTCSDATYLMWVDISALSRDSAAFCQALRTRTGLYVSDGAQFGGDGAGFLRLNVACPRARLDDGLDRLRRGATA